MEASNALTEEKNQLSRDVLAFQQQLLEQERANATLAMQSGGTHTRDTPDIKVLAKAVNAEQAREARLYGGVRAK
jgi:hypothetical protein